MGQDEIRYSVQLVGEKVGEIANDVHEIKADVKGLSRRVYDLEMAAALARGVSLASSQHRAGWQHRLTVLAGICGAIALALTVLTTVVHL